METLILYHLHINNKNKTTRSKTKKLVCFYPCSKLKLTLVQKDQDYETYECKLQLHEQHQAWVSDLAFQGQVDQHWPTFCLTNSFDSNQQTISVSESYVVNTRRNWYSNIQYPKYPKSNDHSSLIPFFNGSGVGTKTQHLKPKKGTNFDSLRDSTSD